MMSDASTAALIGAAIAAAADRRDRAADIPARIDEIAANLGTGYSGHPLRRAVAAWTLVERRHTDAPNWRYLLALLLPELDRSLVMSGVDGAGDTRMRDALAVIRRWDMPERPIPEVPPINTHYTAWGTGADSIARSAINAIYNAARAGQWERAAHVAIAGIEEMSGASRAAAVALVLHETADRAAQAHSAAWRMDAAAAIQRLAQRCMAEAL